MAVRHNNSIGIKKQYAKLFWNCSKIQAARAFESLCFSLLYQALNK